MNTMPGFYMVEHQYLYLLILILIYELIYTNPCNATILIIFVIVDITFNHFTITLLLLHVGK